MTTQWSTTGRPMSRIGQRFWGAVGQRILDSGALDGTQYKAGSTADETARIGEYGRRWAYYLNDDLYKRLYHAGHGETFAGMPVYFNPVPAVVDFYASTALPGDAAVEPTHAEGDAEALRAAVALIWRWSNWPQLRRDLTVTAAVLSDVFVKVAERTRTAEEPATAVYMQDIPPQTVRWWDADERGYLTGIRIDTPLQTSIFTGEERRHVLVEVWRKEWSDGFRGVRYYEAAPHRMLDDTTAENAVSAVGFEELGYDFIPIVWARIDTPWRRQVAHIDRYNAVAWQMARLNRPLAVVGAGGNDAAGRPLAPPLGAADGLESLYSEPGDGVMGVVRLPGLTNLQWAGTPVDFGAMMAMLAEMKESIIDGLPEYRVSTLRGIQVATETMQLLMNQAESRALALRDGLTRALVRAQMMAITIAQVGEVAPEVFARERLGTYEDGRTEHEFTAAPVFVKSAAAKAGELAELVAAGASIEGAATVAGYSEPQVKTLVNLSIAEFPER